MVKKLLVALALLISSFVLPVLAENESLRPQPQYEQKMKDFVSNYRIEMQVAEEQLNQKIVSVSGQHESNTDYLRRTRDVTQASMREVEAAVNELVDLYRKQFVSGQASADERNRLVDLEMNIAITVQVTLSRIQKLIGNIKNSDSLSELRIELEKIKEITTNLKNRKQNGLGIQEGLAQLLQENRKPFATICSLVASLCFRVTMNDMLRGLQASAFLESENFNIQNQEVLREFLASRGNNSVTVVITNHEQPLLDIALGLELGETLKTDHHISMTRSSTYPIKPSKHGQDVIFVEDNPVVENTIKLVLSKEGHVTLYIAPEGMLPYNGAQMPMSAKVGAFVIARKLAVELEKKGIVVRFLEAQTNTLQHLTSPDFVPFKTEITAFEVVPTIPLSRNDAWVEKMRVDFENRSNQTRAVAMMDLVGPSSGRALPSARPPEIQAMNLRCMKALQSR